MDLNFSETLKSRVTPDPFETAPRSSIQIISQIRKAGKAYELEGSSRNGDFYRRVEDDLQALYERLPHEPGGHALQETVRTLIRNGKSIFPTAGSTPRPPYEGNLANDAVNDLWELRLELEKAAEIRKEGDLREAENDAPRPVM
jgi:hypothetical protein